MAILESLYKVTEIELVYRNEVKPAEGPQAICSQEAYDLLLVQWNENTIEFFEQFKVLMLNRSGRVLGIYDTSSGGTAGTVVDTKLVFMAAHKANANSIILAHNHSSGQLQLSSADFVFTKQLFAAGNVLDIPVFDHLIVTNNGYFSFADEGVLGM